MKEKLKPGEREVLIEPYWGIGIGYTQIDSYQLIILPFVVVLITTGK